MLQAVRMAAAWFIALGPIGWAIAAVIAVAALVIANWDKIKAWTIKAWTAVVGKVTAAWEAIKGWVKSGVTFVVNLVKAYFNLYVTIIKGALNTALAVVKWVWNAIVQGFTFYVNLGKRIVQNGINAVLAAVNWLKELPGKVAGFFQSMISRVNSKISSLVSFVRRIPSRILSALGSLGTLLKESGRRIIQGLIDGIREKVGAVKDAVTGVLQKARDLLPFSPAKEGPFSGRGWTLYSGRSIGDSLAKGMASQAGSVRAAARALALEAHDPLVSSPAMPGVGALASSSTNGVPEHVTVEIGVKDLEGIRTVEDFLKMIATRTRMNSGVRAVAGG